MTTAHEAFDKARAKATTKPRISLLYSGRDEQVWRCVQMHPTKPGALNVGDGYTPKEAYDYCTQADRHARYVG